ncbi:Linalool dehydratase/isomerase [Colletotrichum fructicola Nara gc5]|uniref:Linalool dehydratase/isomerase n=1 Tax=Colletotrichum fructicola (strain Nara gc5) TaxID=1213859 RepID=A0A7J6INF3_COLFN|nr:Linalool dehydratase/isomerase [Colletotrichum fructicola Nara gc5]
MTTTTETTKTNGVNHLDAAELPSKIAPSSKWVDTSDSIKADPSTSVKASDGPVGDFGWGPWKIQDVLIPPSAGRAVAAFLLTLVLIPVSIFVWFAMGGIAFPIALWIGSSFMAGRLAQDTLFEQSAALWALGCFSGITWLMNNASSLNAAGYSKAQERNKYLVQAVEEQMADAAPAPQSGDRELSLETLRHVQHMIERGLSPRDDFSFHDVIDQFQTGAIRYQLYGTIDALSLYQCHYVPGFHGYLSKACQNAIEKSLQKRIMSYWKWESIFGRFTLSDWDPIKKDNIMVTGYLSAAIGLYGQASGDRQYNKKDALEFVIDDGKHYKTNYEGLADALFNNMTENPYCLYPCEPNWTYSLCNLTGMAGLVISDRLLGRDLGVKLRNRFERSLEEEFTECDGRILPIRSEFTGLTLPGLCGTLTDCINAMLLTAYLPHLAHRNWAMIRKEFLKYDKNGQLEVRSLKGADKMDPRNYRASEGPLRAFIAATAAEFGNEKIRKEALHQLDNTYFPVEATKSGSLRNKRSVSHITNVLVAKAYSNDGKQLDLVLYNGAEPGTFELGFERLVPGKEYSLSTGGSVKANNKGKATVKVSVKGRTQIILKPVV